MAFLAIAPLPFVPGWVQQLCGAFLFMTFSLDTLVCFSAMGEVARFNQISPYWVFGTSLAYYFSGAFVGFLGFGWAFSFGTQLPQLVACFLSLLLIVWCSNYVFQDSYPCSESIADMVEASRSLSMNESRPALWQRKIDRVIEQFELTTRQQEVFRMLVRGRNAQYIAESSSYPSARRRRTSTTSTASWTSTPSKNSSTSWKTSRCLQRRCPQATTRGRGEGGAGATSLAAAPRWLPMTAGGCR